MILLAVGAETLARLMREDGRGPDTAWLLTGPGEPATSDEAEPAEADWPLAAE